MKTNLLLLHGALGSKKQLEKLEDLLMDKYNVWSLDFDGHGENEKEIDFTIQHFAQNVIDFLNEHSIDSIDIFGYSMGGYVALYAAHKWPERIGQIVTLGTKLDWSPASAQKEVKMLNPVVVEIKVPHFANKLQQEHQLDWKKVMNKTAQLMLGMSEGKKLQDHDFKSIEHKVSIGIGDADKMVSIAESEYVANLLPNATLKVLNGVEHPIDKIETEQIVDYIQNELNK